jgi:hypothetical protein
MVLVRPEPTRFLAGRPIQSLVFAFQQYKHMRDKALDAITPLRPFDNTLHDLVYTHGQLGRDWTFADIILSIAQHVPKLRSLTITSFGEQKPMVSFKNSYLARTSPIIFSGQC